MKVCIIGAGPAGSFAAYNLAKTGQFDVEIFENHGEVGKPVQCSGLVTKTIKEIAPIFSGEEFTKIIGGKISKVRLFSENEKLELELKEPDLVLDRERFDKWLSALAEKEGAKLNLHSKFIKFEREWNGGNGRGEIIVHIERHGKIEKIKTDFLIGADGFFSKVSKGLGNEREFIPCVQANIAYKSDPERMDIFFSEKYRELFAWIVPKNAELAEVGLGCKEGTSEKFREFLKERGIHGKVSGHTGGPISLYSKKQNISDRNIFLVGEAATFVKASTLGGIIPSLHSAKALAGAIINGGNYEKELGNLKREMRIHLKIRRALDRFSDADYDALLKMMNKESVKKLLKEHSRDEYSGNSFALKLLMAQPLLTKFLFKAL